MTGYDRLPLALIGVGLLVVGVMVAEVVAIAQLHGQFDVVVIVNLVATLPFVLGLVAGGYWLSGLDVAADRYPRIAAWVIIGLAFMTAFFTLIAIFTQEDLLARVGIVRWAAAAGSGTGAVVGIFESRAIDRAVTAERARIRNEELQRQNARLEEFADVLAHDLRNPLHVASGHLTLVREEIDDDRLDRIEVAHDRMGQIIEETLILARSGQLIDETAAVSLADLVTRSWQNVVTAGATLEIERSAPIRADPDRVQHLFENLIGNAVEHGGSDVTVRAGMLPGGFYIEDNGPGIPVSEREAVFESGYSAEQDGTGFGLAIVKQIADAHGWTVGVTDGRDGGARFEVTGVDVEPPSRPGDRSPDLPEST